MALAALVKARCGKYRGLPVLFAVLRQLFEIFGAFVSNCCVRFRLLALLWRLEATPRSQVPSGKRAGCPGKVQICICWW